MNEVIQRDSVRSHPRVPRTLPQRRRAPRGRHSVHRRQGAHADGVLPHVQRAARRAEADRAQQRLPAPPDHRTRRTAAQPVRMGPDRRHSAAGPRDEDRAFSSERPTSEGVFLPDDVALFIAGRIKSNIRELEGIPDSAARVRVADRPRGDPMSLAQEVLRDVLRQEERAVTIEIIQKFVAEYYQLKLVGVEVAATTPSRWPCRGRSRCTSARR